MSRRPKRAVKASEEGANKGSKRVNRGQAKECRKGGRKRRQKRRQKSGRKGTEGGRKRATMSGKSGRKKDVQAAEELEGQAAWQQKHNLQCDPSSFSTFSIHSFDLHLSFRIGD